ncbi:hypothetical protein NQ317_014780 [Molorchus minor]|uniref:Uncharacterized protein n=1 Tax=Molorchus minor TaxID=1323400 RepID=A0ABQ9JU29_9CUCU|nr:hypothetical protein NQ317_014780 [Molorchus minor]
MVGIGLIANMITYKNIFFNEILKDGYKGIEVRPTGWEAEALTYMPRAVSDLEIQPEPEKRARPHHMLQTEEEVLDIVEDDPSTSTREIARQVNVSQDKVWKTLRENQLYPFHNNFTPGPDYTI